MKKRKRLLVFIGAVVFILLIFNSSTVIYFSRDSLVEDFYSDYEKLYNKGRFMYRGYEKFMEENRFKFIGKYNGGYLFTVNYTHNSSIPGVTALEGIEIYHASAAQFYYYKNYVLKPNIIIIKLEKIYDKGFLDHDDLIDIKSKFEQYKDTTPAYPYYIKDHFPLF